jgi:hypothetical protein
VTGIEIPGGNMNNRNIPPKEITAAFLFEYYLSHQSSFVKSQLLKKLRFDENYKIVSDWIFFVKALLLENASYVAMDNIIVADYDVTGISISQVWNASVEREKAWKEFFGERVYDDYVRLTSGKTTLEKVVCRVSKYKGLYRLLTLLSLPVFALYKIRKHFN